MTQTEALRLALEALEANDKLINGEGDSFGLEGAMDGYYSGCFDVEGVNKKTEDAITAIKATLEAKDEPVAWMYPDDLKRFETSETFAQAYSIEMVSPTQGETVPLYTHPPQRKPLTDEEIVLIVGECAATHQHTDIHFARAIEAAHGIKE